MLGNSIQRVALSACIMCAMTHAALAQQAVPWHTDLAEAQQLAAQSGRLVVMHCWAPWCPPCLQMEKHVFVDPNVGRALEPRFVPVKVNVDHHPEIVQRFSIESLPCDVVIAPDGRVLGKLNYSANGEQYVGKLFQLADANGFGANVAPVGQVAGTPAGQPFPPGVAGMSPPPQAAPSPASVPLNEAGLPYGQAPTAQPQTSIPAQVASAPLTDTSARPETGLAPPTGTPYAATGPTLPAPQPAANEPAMIPSGAPTMPTGGQPPAAPPQVATSETIPPGQASPSQPSASAPLDTAVTPSPFGLDGFCPVELVEHRCWVRGDRRWGAVFEGRTYLFAGPDQQQRFLADPQKYSPVASGNDLVMAVEQGRSVAGKRECGVYCGGHVYLFADETSMARFASNPGHYIGALLQARR